MRIRSSGALAGGARSRVIITAKRKLPLRDPVGVERPRKAFAESAKWTACSTAFITSGESSGSGHTTLVTRPFLDVTRTCPSSGPMPDGTRLVTVSDAGSS
ncbi:MAG: hypothetical protein ACR2HK_13935 [Gemmatimonadales bacterium]